MYEDAIITARMNELEWMKGMRKNTRRSKKEHP